jgi:ABC-2 type transport system permease protein
MATTTSAAPALSAVRETSHFVLTANAFLAILHRDLVITGREFIAFLLQALLQPLFFLFIFGKVLPGMGLAAPNFVALMLPGIVALTILVAAMQGVTLPLVLDLGYAREIDDRLLSPLPITLVAWEKVLFGAMRGVIAGGVIFPLGYLILGDRYAVRTDHIGLLIGLIVLTAGLGSSFGLVMGTAIKPEQISMMFTLIFTPLLFTGCTYYPWGALNTLRWFQIVTLFNPLTYSAEGLRYSMVPPIHGHDIPTLGIYWVLIALSASIVIMMILGSRTFRSRVVS